MTYATKLPMYSTKPCDSTVGAGSVGSRGGNWAGKEDEERSIGAEVMMVAGSGPDALRAGTDSALSLLLLLSLVRRSRSRDEVERETEGDAGRERERRTGRNRALRAAADSKSAGGFPSRGKGGLPRRTYAKASGLDGRIGLP